MFDRFSKSQLVTANNALPGRSTPISVAERHFVHGSPMTAPFPPQSATAIFGLGCFWGAERKFWELHGVITTAVGYAGGFTENPTYEEVCSGRTGHAEVVLVVFDTAITTYRALLETFWESHDPTQGMRQGNDVGTQYRSAIYAVDEAATHRRAKVARRVPTSVGQCRPWSDNHRNCHSREFLLRGGLPPAVPCEEPARLLRHRRNRRGLSGDASERSRLRL